MAPPKLKKTKAKPKDTYEEVISASNYRWTKAQEVQLMDLYEDNKLLYDPTATGYNKREKREAVLEKIGRQLNVPDDEVEMHLRSLRDLYMKKTNPRQLKSGSGYSTMPVRTQFICTRLKFLAQFRRNRKTKSSLPDLENEMYEEEKEEAQQASTSNAAEESSASESGDSSSSTSGSDSDDSSSNASSGSSDSASESGANEEETVNNNATSSMPDTAASSAATSASSSIPQTASSCASSDATPSTSGIQATVSSTAETTPTGNENAGPPFQPTNGTSTPVLASDQGTVEKPQTKKTTTMAKATVSVAQHTTPTPTPTPAANVRGGFKPPRTAEGAATTEEEAPKTLRRNSRATKKKGPKCTASVTSTTNTTTASNAPSQEPEAGPSGVHNPGPSGDTTANTAKTANGPKTKRKRGRPAKNKKLPTATESAADPPAQTEGEVATADNPVEESTATTPDPSSEKQTLDSTPQKHQVEDIPQNTLEEIEVLEEPRSPTPPAADKEPRKRAADRFAAINLDTDEEIAAGGGSGEENPQAQTETPTKTQDAVRAETQQPQRTHGKKRKRKHEKKSKKQAKKAKPDKSGSKVVKASELNARRVAALEDISTSLKADAVPTFAPPTQETDDDVLWGNLLVRRIKQIKNEMTKEDLKQHMNIMALHAVRGQWQIPQFQPLHQVPASPVKAHRLPYMHTSPWKPHAFPGGPAQPVPALPAPQTHTSSASGPGQVPMSTQMAVPPSATLTNSNQFWTQQSQANYAQASRGAPYPQHNQSFEGEFSTLDQSLLSYNM